VSSRFGIRDSRPSRDGGGRGPTDYWRGGGGGGRGGGDDLPSYRERLRRYRMGVLLGLTSVVMLFVSFTTAYVVRKAGANWDPARNDYVSNWTPIALPVSLLLGNTLVLLLSSVTLEAARRRAAEDVVLAPIATIPGIRVSDHDSLPWLWATIALGFMFLGGQYYAWLQLRTLNSSVNDSISSGFFFVLTGVHGAHVIGGLLALMYAGVTAWLQRPPETRRIVIDVTSWYWHFMALLWVYVFALLYFAR